MLQFSSALRCLSLLVLLVLTSSSLSSSLWGQQTLLPAKAPTIGRQLQRKLVQLDNLLNNQQWEEYAELIAELLDEPTDGLISVAGRREEKLYVDFAEICQRKLSQAPAQARDAYRRLVDFRAQAIFDRSLDGPDEQSLRQVADTMLCSSCGDDALWLLGELALSRGEFLAARLAWEKLVGLSYPESSISSAEVSARLALNSLRAGQRERAEQEIQQLKQRYPQAQGVWSGRSIVFAEELSALLEEAQSWRPLPVPNAWPSLGGNFQRTQSLPLTRESDLELAWHFPWSPGESNQFHPPVIGDQFIVCQDTDGIHALNRQNGESVFTADSKLLRQPVSSLLLYRDQVIGASDQQVWAIDTHRDGALAFRLTLDQPTEHFSGDGVIDGTHLLLELRSQDQFARSGIACFDLSTQELIWKRWVSSANIGSTIRGTSLAASPGVVYLSTNLGAIAAVRVVDGRILWLRTYARSSPGQPNVNSSCCLLAGDTLVVAPLDSRQLLAIDPTNGRLLWTRSGVVPSGSLVGAASGTVVLNSNGLHILDVRTGDVVASNFDFIPSGQCLLVGGIIYIPTQQGIQRIDLNSAEPITGGTPLSVNGSFGLLGCGDCLLAASQERLSMFRPLVESSGQTDGK